VRSVRFEAPAALPGWGALTPWGRGASAWSDQAPRRFGPDDEALAPAARRLDRFGLLALAAARDASAGDRVDESCGVLVGSRHGCTASNRLYGEDLERLPPRELRPALFVRTISGSAAADVSIALRLRGPSQTFVSGNTAGAEALISAALMDATCLVGGVEAPPGGGDASRLEAAAFALLTRGGGAKALRFAEAALGRDLEGGGTADLIADGVRAGCDLVAVSNPATPEVLALWRKAAGRARVLELGEHGDLGAAGSVLAAGLSDMGCDRGAVVVARDPSGETALLRFER
jgi:hypothetical protein